MCSSRRCPSSCRAAVEILAAGEFRRPFRSEQERRPPHSRPGHRIEPERHLRDVAAYGHPLGLAARRNGFVRHARAHLDADRPARRREGLHKGQRRRKSLGVPDPLGSGRGRRAPRRIQPDPVGVTQRNGSGVRMHHRGVRKRNEVDGGAGGRGFIHLHGGHRDVQGSQRHGVSTQTAPQVGHVPDARLGETLGVPRGHVEPCRLLQPGLGEQHLAGELAELALGLGPEARLRQHGRDQLGGVARLAETGSKRHGRVLAVGTKRCQQLPPFLGQKLCDLVLRCVRHAFKPSGVQAAASR